MQLKVPILSKSLVFDQICVAVVVFTLMGCSTWVHYALVLGLTLSVSGAGLVQHTAATFNSYIYPPLS